MDTLLRRVDSGRRRGGGRSEAGPEFMPEDPSGKDVVKRHVRCPFIPGEPGFDELEVRPERRPGTHERLLPRRRGEIGADHPKPCRIKLRDRRPQVAYEEREVVEPRAPLVEMPLEEGIGSQRLHPQNDQLPRLGRGFEPYRTIAEAGSQTGRRSVLHTRPAASSRSRHDAAGRRTLGARTSTRPSTTRTG